MLPGMSPLKIALLLTGLMIAACQPSLQVAPRSPHSLAGTWVADAQACAAVETQLKNALQSAKERELHDAMRRNAKRIRLQEEAMSAKIESGSWEIKEQEEQYSAMLDTFVPHAELAISDGTGQIVLAPMQAARRTFDPGGSSTLVTSFAHLHVVSGWQMDDFVVSSVDSKAGIAVTERYRLQSDHSLALSLTVSLKYMDTQQYLLIYRKHTKA